MKVNVNL